jgi:WD40 repeat protein
MSAATAIKYSAFLSYAHANAHWAKRIHRRLEDYRIDKDLVGRETRRGPVPQTLRPIFRDQEDFTGGHSLTDATVAALDASAALIVLCSPQAASRPAVNEEVRLFRSRHPDRPVIPVIIDGTYPENVPPALRYAVLPDGTLSNRTMTILGPDLRDSGDGISLALAKIVAGLIGVGTDEIARRAERDQQRRLRRWLAGLSSVATALAGLAGVAFWQQHMATIERDNALIIQSRFLADTAERLVGSGNATSGMLVALEGLPGPLAGGRRPYVAQAEVSLYHALHHRKEQMLFSGSPNKITNVFASPDGSEIYLFCSDHTIRVVAVDTMSVVRTLEGHRGYLTSLAFNSSGDRLVTVASDSTAQVWRRNTGARELVLRGHERGAHFVEFSPDGSLLLTASDDGTVRLWNSIDGKPSHLFRFKGRANRWARFDPSGRYVATRAAGQGVDLWDVETGELLFSFVGSKKPDVEVFVFNPKGDGIVVQPSSSEAVYWSISKKKVIATLPHYRHGLSRAVFSPDGRLLATSGQFDNTVFVWDVINTRLIQRLKASEHVSVTTFSPDGTLLVTRSGTTAQIWEVASGRAVGYLRGHTAGITFLHFFDGGSKIVSAANDGTVRIWDAREAKQIAVFSGHEILTTNAAVYIDKVIPILGGSKLVTYSNWDKTVRIWNVENFIDAPATPKHPHRVASAAFTNDGKSIFTTALDGRLRFFSSSSARFEQEFRTQAGSEEAIRLGADSILTREGNGIGILNASTGRQMLSIHYPGHNVASIAGSLDGARIASGGVEGFGHVWDARTGGRICTIAGHGKRRDDQPNWIVGLSFDPRGQYLASAGLDNIIRLWDAQTCAKVAALEGHSSWPSSVVFHPDGKTLLSSSFDQTAHLWDVTSRSTIRIFEGHEQILTRAAFNPKGDRIATSSNDKTARIWNTQTGEMIANLRGHLGAIQYISFSADGSLVATASSDNTARIWKLFPSTAALIEFVVATVPRCLTPTERARFFLSPKPPRWCITGRVRSPDNKPEDWKGKWPYDTPRWRSWLSARDGGAAPSLPQD